jgi:DNA-binding response OmpR family regulator
MPAIPNVLIIDDSTLDLRLLMEMMSAHNMRISVAFDGKDGYNKAINQKPDLILLDVVMPIQDGFTTCRKLKSNLNTRNIPIIFLSAANEIEKRLEGLSLGAADFIGKPFDEREVIARVEVHLNLIRQRTQRAIKPPISENTSAPRRDELLIRLTTHYLREHLRKPPSTENLAKLFNTHEKRLNQAYHACFGMPVFAWLREERLRQARSLLTTTTTPIAAISDHLGYSTPANFSKAFRERFGCSPRDLRMETRNRLIETTLTASAEIDAT